MTVILLVLAISVIIFNLQEFIYARYWNKNLTLDIHFSKNTAYEGEKLFLTEVITNRKLLPMPWLSVKFAVSPHLIFDDTTNTVVSDYFYRNDLFSIMVYQKITRNLEFKCQKRGLYTIRSAGISSSNILMTQKLAEEKKIEATLTVYPRLLDVSSFEASAKKLLGDAFARRFINPDPFQIKSIREYMPTDEFKNINFKASAKSGGLMVSIKDYTVAQEITIVLNMESPLTWILDDIAEESIRLAASIAEHFINSSISTGILSNGRDIITDMPISEKGGSSWQHLTNIYESLARIDISKPVDKLTEGIRRQASGGESERIYVLISAYYGKDFQSMYEYIKEEFSAIWIVPAMIGDKVDIPENIPFIRWDVDINDKNKSLS